MRPENFVAKIGARINEFTRKMKQVDAAVRKTAMGTDKPIGADISRFLRKAAEVAVVSRTLARDKVIVPIEARINDFQSKMDRIANSIRSLSTVITNQIGGAFLAISPSIVPIIAALTGALGNIGPMLGTIAGSSFALASALGVAGTAGIGFGSIMVGNLNNVFAASEDLKKLQEKLDMETDGEKRNKILEEMAQIQGNLNKNQTKALNSMTKLSDVWSKTKKQFEGQSVDLFARSLEILSTTIKRLKPLFEGTFKAADRLMGGLEKAMNSEGVLAFFDTLNETGGTLFETFGKATGNVIKGLMNMTVAFAPLARTTSEGFLAMTERFEEWSSNLSNSKGFNKFVDYVNTNMPKIRSIFRDAIAGTIHLFAGFGDSASGMMDGLVDMMSRYKNWASELGNNQGFQTFLQYVSDNAPKVLDLIGNLTGFIVNLGVGLAPLGSKILDLINRFLEWTNEMMNTHKWIGSLVGIGLVLGGMFLAVLPTLVALMTLFSGIGPLIAGLAKGAFGLLKKAFFAILSPVRNVVLALMILGKGALLPVIAVIVAVVAVIGTLIAVFVRLWKENETFRNNVTSVWNAIYGVISTMAMAVYDFVVEIIGKLVTWWQENQEFFKSSAKNAWDFIYTVVVAGMKGVWDYLVDAYSYLQPFIAAAWSLIVNSVSTAWSFITTVVSAGVDIVLSIVNAFMAILGGDWSRLWSEILNILSVTWSLIKDLVKVGIDFVKGILSTGFQLLLTITVNIWNSLGSKISEVWSMIKSATSAALSMLVKWAISKFTDILSNVSEKMSAVKDYISRKWDEAKSAAAEKLAALIRTVATSFTQVVGKIREKMSEAVQKVSDFVSEMPGKVTAFVSDMVSAGGDLIGGVISGISGKVGEAYSAVKSFGSNLLTNFKNSLLVKSPSRKFAAIAKWIPPGVAKGVKKTSGKAVSAVTGLSSAMASAFAPELKKDMAGTLTWSSLDVTNELDTLKKQIKQELDLTIDINHNGKPGTEQTSNTSGNQTIIFNQPVKSPSEQAQQIKKVSQELAWGV
ncbi:hypothetical protein [Jeotgalibacillus haloalkalitolerans]|uniref:Tape measure protein n=1 Tax=Jeotgalibacillus haloalkalitolerans TaxID=3104292 RepID=A0ABU5KK72_9BACL|nr:hypothetical protein [Jeotgalibacillus sp. HH7-29]MDZ5711665.1 hypothetical protein [Jeotgalibacillus sp. HH7-29]